MVTDADVETLRTLLSADPDQQVDLVGTEPGDGFSALVLAAFQLAARRRFGATDAKAAVIAFVADFRSRYSAILASADRTVNALEAEHILEEALGRARPSSDAGAQDPGLIGPLLYVLVRDEQPDPAELSVFLSTARVRAEQLL
jgi:hypothetical protein